MTSIAKRLVAISVLWVLMGAGLALPNISLAANDYVGSAVCADCHQTETALWTNSHHDLAMQEASANTVLGDFNNVSFTYQGVTSEFSRKDGDYWVRTDNAHGELENFKVAYVFGVYPLQQLLLSLPGGRLQALSVAWDARPKTEGGQRWYHIYENTDEDVSHSSPLHWTGIYHNWNSRCAECHSTDVHKNYNLSTDSYDTQYQAIDVGCEACHGPGAQHIDLARRGALSASNNGLVVSLAGKGLWTREAQAPVANRISGPTASLQTESCGRCHSRRATLGDYQFGKPLSDTHRISSVQAPLYWHDGQIRDEVYVYGSFMQSKMAAAGVVCSNCHEPHSNALVAEGNGVCTQCHQPERYDQASHHRHPVTSSGAACVNCHMPDQLYMGVDARRDHSMRIPRPDVSISTGSPNACTQCHQDQTDSWANDVVNDWGVKPDIKVLNQAKARMAADRGDLRALPSLEALVSDNQQPSIIRSAATEQITNLGSPRLSGMAAMLLRDDDPMVRASAVRAAVSLPLSQRYLMLRPLMTDPILSVRLEVASMLAGSEFEGLREKDIEELDALYDEYLEVQSEHLDMPSVQLQLANFWLARRDSEKAEVALKHALRQNPQLEPAIINLVDLLRQQDRNDEASELLQASLATMPTAGSLWFAKGLHDIRGGDRESGIAALEQAAELEEEGSRHRYVFAVALFDTGEQERAIKVLERLNRIRPGQPDILNALMAYSTQLGDRVAYNQYRAQLISVMRATGSGP
jgi:predicted CXXCH cytochrome family protein